MTIRTFEDWNRDITSLSKERAKFRKDFLTFKRDCQNMTYEELFAEAFKFYYLGKLLSRISDKLYDEAGF